MDRLLNSKADDAVQSSEETLRQTEVYDEIREKTSTILLGRNQDSNNIDKKGKPASEASYRVDKDANSKSLISSNPQ
jgi:rRNA maturation endonuclease Nob1